MSSINKPITPIPVISTAFAVQLNARVLPILQVCNCLVLHHLRARGSIET